MIRAYRLFTGPDGHSHVETGSIRADAMVDALSLEFQETMPHAAFSWHTAPHRQYVITLSGVLEFKTKLGQHFTVCPGDVLIAMDDSGSGHEWRLINDEPWKRAYVVFKPGADVQFLPDAQAPL